MRREGSGSAPCQAQRTVRRSVTVRVPRVSVSVIALSAISEQRALSSTAMTRKLNRRQALAALGTVSLGSVLAACGDDEATTATTTSAPVTTQDGGTATVQTKTTAGASSAEFDEAATCAVTAELTEGPYYFDVDAIRSDIREDREGTTLRLAIRVRDAQACEPIENAVVDIWHCDALGIYSGFESASQGGPGGGRSDDETYLRGAQVTNADGAVEFVTVYPGWYRGRTVHIHAKVHLDKQTVLTTQLFFDEDLNTAVFAKAPYSGDSGRDVFNDGDGIFDASLVCTAKLQDDDVRALMTFDVQRA